ncbi:ABC transporter ATP-binding protein [Peptoniphilus vaginalis]|uniref:ABC transporter ATP-binding protein n=1 Tax=Peptoniphilus vaginalis TaxID=1756987 RepID=UPI000A269871|nr:ABC transporter ATP-binding protein [Peptoniphilus vaginalis]
MDVINVKNLFHSFDGKNYTLKDISLSLKKAESIAIMGPSGSGKSTLLYCLCGMIRASKGEILFLNKDIRTLSSKKLNELYRKNFDFIFQDINLIPVLNVEENIKLKSSLNKKKLDTEKIKEILQLLNLSGKEKSYPTKLSGGQRQKVAIARALLLKPDLIFADEPTGSLDTNSSYSVLEEMRKLKDIGTSTIVVTHDPNVAIQMDRVLFLLDGQLRQIINKPTINEILEIFTNLEKNKGVRLG